MDELTADANRTELGDATGIYVRATLDGRWFSADMAQLDSKSLLAFLRSRGGDNPWAENVVGILLGHGHLHPPA